MTNYAGKPLRLARRWYRVYANVVSRQLYTVSSYKYLI